MLSTEEAARFISPPPTTIEGFERFIEWAIAERRVGNYVCFAVVPEGMTSAVGLFQMRALDPTFGVAEWGFAIGSAFWGTGAFVDAARLVIAFAFETVGVHRLEARASVAQRTRQRGAAQDWRGAGRRAPSVVPPQRPASRSGDVVVARGGLARRSAASAGRACTEPDSARPLQAVSGSGVG